MKHKQIIEKWGSPKSLADDLGVKYHLVYGWFRRDSIPNKHWKDIITAASARGFDGVNLNTLLKGAE